MHFDELKHIEQVLALLFDCCQVDSCITFTPISVELFTTLVDSKIVFFHFDTYHRPTI